MAGFQASTYEAHGQRVSPEDMELTSFFSLDSQAHDYDDVDISNHNDLSTSSGDKLHQSLDVDHVGLTGPYHLQQMEDTQYCSLATDTGHRSAVQRMGTYSVLILAITTAFMLLILSFLSFLWTARHENSFWRLIVVNGWAGGAVTLSSLLLRTAVDLQAGIAVAMLAAIILETGHVLLVDTVQVSRLRAGRAVPTDVVVPFWNTIRYNQPQNLGGHLRVLVALVLVATTIFLQFTSTMLVSDLSLGVLPGTPQRENLPFDFAYEWDEKNQSWRYPEQRRAAPPWLRNPPAFPTYAEFSGRIDVPEHIDDTGELFRAFLPFQDAQSRQTISQYSGKALVLDARVSCQRPQFEQLRVESEHFSINLVGAFSKTDDVPGLFGSASSVPFNCPYIYTYEARSPTLSICQPSGHRYGDGKLLSKLRDGRQWSRVAESWSNGSFAIDDRPNAAYLIFNSTIEAPERNSDTKSSTISEHGSWTEVSYLETPIGLYTNFSVTLCYPAIWTARLSVALQSLHNRTEPRASSFNRSFSTTPDVHVQMGELKHDHEKSTLESRGILSLSPKHSWLPDPSDARQYDYIGGHWLGVQNSFFAMSAALPKLTYDDFDHESINCSLAWEFDPTHVVVDEQSPDSTLASIFTTSLQVTNGSAATALSTIITLLASMAYYDQIPNFAETAHGVSTTYLQPFVFPQSFRGFTAVLAITFAHYILILFIVAAFVTFTRLSTLGDHWQTISQIISPATEEILQKSSRATDKEVRQGLEAEHREHEMASLQVLSESDGRVGLVARKPHRRRNHDMGL